MSDSIDVQRAGVYEVFSMLFSRPLVLEDLSHIQQWTQDLDDPEFMAPIVEWFNERRSLGIFKITDAIVEDIAKEYTLLLGGISAEHGPPPPYESLYMSIDQQSALVHRAKLQALYQQYSAHILDPYGQASDHLVAELQFMQHLASHSMTLDLQKQFLNEQLLSWVPKWRTLIGEFDNKSLYSAFARSLECFLEEDVCYSSGSEPRPSKQQSETANCAS